VDDGQATLSTTSVPEIFCTAAVTGDTRINELITTLRAAATPHSLAIRRVEPIGRSLERSVTLTIVVSPQK
jgi:hypothetical protein